MKEEDDALEIENEIQYDQDHNEQMLFDDLNTFEEIG